MHLSAIRFVLSKILSITFTIFCFLHSCSAQLGQSLIKTSQTKANVSKNGKVRCCCCVEEKVISQGINKAKAPRNLDKNTLFEIFFYFYFFKLTIQIQYLPICLRATFLQQHLKIFCKKIKHIRKFSLVLICKQSLIRDICPVQIIFCLVENVSNVQKNTSDKICSI